MGKILDVSEKTGGVLMAVLRTPHLCSLSAAVWDSEIETQHFLYFL